MDHKDKESPSVHPRERSRSRSATIDLATKRSRSRSMGQCCNCGYVVSEITKLPMIVSLHKQFVRQITKFREIRLFRLQNLRYFFEEKYNTEEFEKILKIINENDKDGLKRYIISYKRVGELLRLKTEKGSFSHLDDLIPIMGVKVLEKFYGSMLDKKSLGLGNPIVPSLSIDQISSFERVLSLNVSGNCLSWSLIRRLKDDSVKLEALYYKPFAILQKSHFLVVLSQMTDLAQELPTCDLCVCEEFPSQVPSTNMFSYFLQTTQARSMLLAVLASRPAPPKMISIKTVAIAKTFNTYVGSEKVSGQHIVDTMFETSDNLEIETKLRYYYLDSESEVKEHLSNTFLVNLAYWKLTNQFMKFQ